MRVRVHAERLEDVTTEVAVEGLAADHFDDPRGDPVVRVVVTRALSRWSCQRRRAQHADAGGERRRERPTLLVKRRIRHA